MVKLLFHVIAYLPWKYPIGGFIYNLQSHQARRTAEYLAIDALIVTVYTSHGIINKWISSIPRQVDSK